MAQDFNAGDVLREARARARLTQRELARRAGTAQSVVARIERGQTDPSTGTLRALLAAAGFELDRRARMDMRICHATRCALTSSALN
ncbi:MAG: helix-turn-helix domain-containing protein [Longimicrobiales bacterium]